MIHKLNSSSAVPHIFSQASEWKHLHIFVLVAELRNPASIGDITDFLMMFRPPALQDVTVQLRVSDERIIYASWKKNAAYIDACLKFQEALSRFTRHRLSLLVSSKLLDAKKHLWTHEFGQLFPKLRDLDELTVHCEASERRYPGISSI